MGRDCKWGGRVRRLLGQKGLQRNEGLVFLGGFSPLCLLPSPHRRIRSCDFPHLTKSVGGQNWDPMPCPLAMHLLKPDLHHPSLRLPSPGAGCGPCGWESGRPDWAVRLPGSTFIPRAQQLSRTLCSLVPCGRKE